MTRTDLLNYLIERYGYKTYLEIGVDNGVNFEHVNAITKWSVDPNRPAYSVMTSDQFFQSVCKTFGECHPLYDLIFIDGLHEEKQVLRDIENSLKILNVGGTIVVHDCNPIEEKHQSEKRGNNSHWNGTVWRAWVQTRESHDDLSMFVLDMDEGCGIIQRGLPRGNVDVPLKFDWTWLCANRKSALNLISFDEWKEQDGHVISAKMFQYWDANPPSEVLDWMNSWLSFHPHWDYVRFTHESAREFLVEHLGRRQVAAYDSCLLASSKSNILRYCALYVFGGVWADSDLECLASIDGIWSGARRGIIIREAKPMPGLAIAGYKKPDVGETEIRNDFLLFKKPQDKLVEKMLNTAIVNVEASDGSSGTSWDFTGPRIWCDLYKHNERAFDSMDIMWYSNVVEWAYREHAYKQRRDYWANVRKGTPIFKAQE